MDSGIMKMKDVLYCPHMMDKYDATDIQSIFNYAVKIEGKTFLQILQEAGLSDESIKWVELKQSDKGLPGKIVEASYFGYELNSRQEADFEYVGVELKTTAADMDTATSKYKSGETISITQIDFKGPVEENFYLSHLYQKLKMLIVIFYHRDKSKKSKLQYEVIYSSLFEPTEHELAIIKSDYREIIKKIMSGQAHTLSRADGTYLSTAPKAQKSTNTVVPYYGGESLVKRSYTLRKEYVNVILEGYYSRPIKEERIINDVSELEEMSFAQIIQRRFSKFIGKKVWDIARELNKNPIGIDGQPMSQIEIGEITKATFAQLTARMLGLRALRSEELIKAGIVVKTVKFDSKGKNKENLRLGDVDFMEIFNSPASSVVVETDENGVEQEYFTSSWESSELYAQLDTLKYLFVVFQDDNNGGVVFRGCKLWAMSDGDIALAEKDWKDIKKVITNGVELVVGEDGRTHNNFPGPAKARRIHLRPHAQKAFYVDANGKSWGNGKLSDTVFLPDGRRMSRQSYWLKNSFVREILKDLLK